MAIDIEKLKTDINELLDKAAVLDNQIDLASAQSKAANQALETLINKRTELRETLSDKLRKAKLLPEV